MRIINILLVQRKAMAAPDVNYGLSVYARIAEPLDYLFPGGEIRYHMIHETKIKLEKKQYDIIIFSKHCSDISVKIAQHAQELGIKIIYDLDDAILSVPSYSACEISETKKINFDIHMKLADIVTISTPRLKRKITEYTNRETTVVGNGFNFQRYYKERINTDNEKINIIFTNGDNVKLNTFRNDFYKTINVFLEKNRNGFLDVICELDSIADNFLRYRCLGSVDWAEHKRILMQGDYSVGIVPLGGEEDPADLEFNSCKSPFKYLEYGGLKIAGIYSKSPIHTDVVEDRYNGLLVDNTFDAWSAALEELTNNKKLHTSIIENAQRDVKENHSVSKAAKQWMNVIQQAMELS